MADSENGDQHHPQDLDDADEQQSQKSQTDENLVADDVSFHDDNNEEVEKNQNANDEEPGDENEYHQPEIIGQDGNHEGFHDFHDSDQDQNENHEDQGQNENLEDQGQSQNYVGQEQTENNEGQGQIEINEDKAESEDQEAQGQVENNDRHGKDYENKLTDIDASVGQMQNEIATQFDQESQEHTHQADVNVNSLSQDDILDKDEDDEDPVPDGTDPVADKTAEGEAENAEVINQFDQSADEMPIPDVAITISGPSVEPSINPSLRASLEATATVKFMMMPSGQVVTLACTLGQTLESLKSHFASELKMSVSMIMLVFDGKSMTDSTTLADLGVVPNGTVQLEMQSADPVNSPLKAYRARQEYHMPDVITVRVITEDCETKDVVVEIERSRTKKPFLGGFRNRNTGTEFHNASAQTMHKQRPPPTTERFCRDTQTCEQRNMRQQTNNDTSTQMTGIRIYVSNLKDKLLAPGQYCTADEYWAMILNMVLILQKNFRRWLAKRYVKKLKEDKEKRLEWERLEELRKKQEKEERLQREYARRINPRTKADFDRLLHCLEKWRTEEMERIDSKLIGAERKAAICMLLDQETELLSAIERHKNDANYENRATRIMKFLEKAAAPKMWQAHDGRLTYMDTPFTIRAKELRDIYNSVNMKYLTQDERLDVLLTLKHTVKEHDCKLTQEIIELIDREADLLMRGVKESNLTGLRKRICTLYLQYIKTPTFNPEAAKYLKVPQDFSTLRKNINYCHSCGCYLPSTEFFITTNSRNSGRCRNCQKIENQGRQRHDHTYFRVMLKALHKSEETIQDGSTLCYLLQENDIRYLVENIWSNQSVLSAWCDPYDLVLCRWNKHQEWSPWNCILLTHDEAEAHKKLFSLEEGYGHVFIHKVTQKHNFAKNYFSRLPGMSEILRKNIKSKEVMKMERSGVAAPPAGKTQNV